MYLKGKKLLIMGATTETIKLVQTANNLGVITYVADPFEDAPAKVYASVPLLVDCMDVDKICSIVKQESIDGVLVGCADVLVPVYQKVCERLNKYCYVSAEGVGVLANKKGLKKKLREVGLPTIDEYSYDEASKLTNKYPLFLKPVDNNSSKGMSIVYSPEELDSAYNKALDYSRSKTVLVERLMQCDDFAVGYIFQNGKVGVTYTADRFVNSEQKGVGTITAGVMYPSKYNDLYFKTTHDKMLKLFNDIGYKNGILSIQGFVEDGKIMFYDPAMRISGGQEYVLNKYFNNIDMLACLVCYALTGSMSSENEVEKCNGDFNGQIGCNLAFSVKPGIIGRIDGMDYARNHPNVINVTQEHFSGDLIDKVGTAQQNFSRMHLVAENAEEMVEVIKDLQRHVIAYDSKGTNMMLSGMDADSWLKNYKNR